LITLIWAMDRNRLIGNHGTLPWPHIAADMRWFRQQTEGKTIIMGRSTFDSIGKPLPKRHNIVLSTKPCSINGVEVISSIHALLAITQQQPKNEWMVIGGAHVYAQMLQHADRLIYTEIDGLFEGDVWFPPLNNDQWHIIQQQHQPVSEASPYALTFTCANRKNRITE